MTTMRIRGRRLPRPPAPRRPVGVVTQNHRRPVLQGPRRLRSVEPGGRLLTLHQAEPEPDGRWAPAARVRLESARVRLESAGERLRTARVRLESAGERLGAVGVRLEGGLRGRLERMPVFRPGPSEAGASTAEYAMTIMAAAAFSGVLIKIITSGAVKGLLTNLVTRALA